MKVRSLDPKPQVNLNSDIPVLHPPAFLYVHSRKGQGKTNTILFLLCHENGWFGKFNEIIWVSPTYLNDWDKLSVLTRTKGLIVKNKKLLKKLKKEVQRKPGPFKDDDTEEEFDGCMQPENFKQEFTIDDLRKITKEQQIIVRNYGRDYLDQVLLVLDDSLGADLLRDKEFLKMMSISRHLKISVILSLQVFHGASKSLRLQADQHILFQLSNEKELYEIFCETVPNLTWPEFLRLFREITNVPYGFMTINTCMQGDKRFGKGFEQFIKLPPSELDKKYLLKNK